MNRRSFLAALMGAGVLTGAVPSQADILSNPDGTIGPGLWHYSVYDSLIVEPGRAFNERLFLPPFPEFTVKGLGVFYSPAAGFSECGDLWAIGAGVVVDVGVFGDSPLLGRAPLACYPSNSRLDLPLPVEFGPGRELRLSLSSSGVALDRPVRVSILLDGYVKGPLGVAE